MRGENDTISQIATPLGAGGIGIIRVSGADALSVARAVFRPARGGHLRENAPNTQSDSPIFPPDHTAIDH